MSSINLIMIFFSAIFGLSTFFTLDSILRAQEWEYLDNEEKVIFWSEIRDIGIKLSLISLVLSLALNLFS